VALQGENRGGGPILWVDNIKLLAMLGVISFHFWLFFNKRTTDPLHFLSSVKAFLSIPFELGWQGNQLFFAASGLGLALSCMRKRPSWTQFIVARAWRIYLPYWVTISTILIYQAAMHWAGSWDVPYVLPKSAQEWGANVFLLNIGGTTYLSTHHWFLFSLVVLYVAFPLFFALCRKLGVFALVVTTCIQAAVLKFPPDLGVLTPFTYISFVMGSFCVGILFGIALHEDRQKLESRLRKSWPIGVVLWLAATLMSLYNIGAAAVDPLIAISGFICVYQIARLPWSFPWLNKLSFEIYLVHMPFVGFYRHFFGFVEQPLWAIYAFYLVSTVAMAALVHMLVVLVGAGLRRLRSSDKGLQPAS